MRQLSVLFCVVFLTHQAAFAQRNLDEIRTWVHFEITPGLHLQGPYKGVLHFQIGRGYVRAMIRPRIELQVIHDDVVEQRVDFLKLPGVFDWDTTSCKNERYILRLVAIDDRSRSEIVMDEIQGRVDNPGARVEEPEPVVEQAPVPAGPPVAHFATRPVGGTVSGISELPIADWPTGASARYLPVIDVYRDGVRIDSQGAGGQAPFLLRWNTLAMPNGTYTLKLTVLNLADNAETVTDEMTVFVDNRRAPVKPTSPQPQIKVPRGSLTSRNGFGIPRGTRSEQFKWVYLASKALRDPFPEVAAAQWALESAWGRSTSGLNNYFGIKAAGDQPGTDRETTEWGDNGIYSTTARFADYDSPTDGIAARLKFLKRQRYSGYWTAANADAAARALQRGGYATDPSYASQLIAIMRRMGY